MDELKVLEEILNKYDKTPSNDTALRAYVEFVPQYKAMKDIMGVSKTDIKLLLMYGSFMLFETVWL